MKYKLLRFCLLSIFAMLCGTWGSSAFADTWVKTSPSQLQSGDVVVIVDQTSSTAMPNDKGTSSAPNAAIVSLSSDKSEIISDVTDNLQWVVTVTNGSYTFNVAGTDNYIYATNTNNGVRVGTNENNAFTIIDNDGVDFLLNTVTNRYIGVYNSQDWRCYTSINSNIKNCVTAFYKKAENAGDTRIDTEISISSELPATMTIGETLPLPAAVVAAATNVISDAVVEWTSTNTDVAEIANGNVIAKAVGTTTIKVTYAGDESSYKASSASFALTVRGAPYTSFAALQADAKSGNTPVTINFSGQQVVFVNGSNAFLADADGNGLLIYTINHGLEAGEILNGSLDCALTLYQGNTEVTGFSKQGLNITTAAVSPVEKTIADITKASQSTLVTLKGLTYTGGDDKLFSDGTNTILFYDKFRTDVELTEGGVYDVTGIVVMFNDKIEICPRTADDIVAAAVEEPLVPSQPELPATATWNFTNADVVAAVTALSRTSTASYVKAIEDNGLLLTVEANGQIIRDNENSIQTGDGVVFKVPVQGKKDVVTVTGYSAPYFAYSVAGTDATEAVTSYTAKAADVAQGFVEIVNKGQYLISIKVEQKVDDSGDEPGETSYPITAKWDFQNLTPASIADVNIQGTKEGDVASDVDGIVMHVISSGGKLQYNSAGYAQFNTNTTLQVPVGSTTDVVTVVSYPGQSNYTVGGENATGQNTFSHTATAAEVAKGYVEIVPSATAYIYSVTVVQNEPVTGPATLDGEAVTATFPFNLGTEGQKATFSGDYFLSSKVSYGSNLSIKDKNAGGGFDQTRFDVNAKETAAAASNLIQFLITPKPGFTFTPTKVSLKSTRFGTNGGKLDIAWQNADGTTKSLATDVLPNRNDGTKPAIAAEEGQKFSNLSYDVTGATPGEGACGLALNLYSLDPGKQVGFADIVIEGTLSGTEKDIPILASFKINGTEYTVEDVFGEQYEATLKLSKKEAMVGQNNPLTDITAGNGETGTVAYEGTETACTVTIPMTAGSTQMDYVLSIIQKPDYTLSYIAVDGTTVLKTQTVEEDGTIGEFAYDIANVEASKDGFKACGWFKQNYAGAKFTTADVITANTSLYAVETEIETTSLSRKYVYNLTSDTFYDEDHEGFNSIGSGYWHDKQHGWAFGNGDKIELLVGPKATINFTLCAYSADDATIVGSNGESINAKVDSDGGTGTIQYDGEAGTLTLTITGTTYIHGITVFNTSEANYEKQGDWLIVKKDDASSLLDALEVATGLENAKIFLPDGTYDLGNTAQTTFGGTNVSLIGQSAEKTVIVTKPVQEGLGTGDLLVNTGTGLYMQDLSLKNDYSYGGNDGRAASLHDKGTKTIAKNIFLLSHQDTYYSNKTGGLYYFEGGELHGTVDYLCGNGRVYFNEVKLVNEVRGSATITANSELYVFNNCTVENNANTYNFGRAWSDNPTCIFLNTTLLDPSKLVAKRWLETGINCNYTLAGEYGTKNASGQDITPASNVVTFNKNGNTTIETILTADQAAQYTIDYVLGDWASQAQAEAKQVEAPQATYANGKVTWKPANNGAIAYALFKNGEFLGITDGSSFDVTIDEAQDKLTIRAANKRGGFGPAADVKVSDGSYEFLASEWIAGDVARISPDNVVANADNTITVSQTGQNNVALIFRSANTYKVKATERYFVIKATGLSTESGKSYLWWLNNTNDGSQIEPTDIYEEDGVTVFAWDAATISIGGDLGKADTDFKDNGGWSTTFGMTLADDAVPAVISFIGFTDKTQTPAVEYEYAWNPAEWQAGDPARISADNVTVDETAKTITVSQTGQNNVALVYKTDDVVYVEDAKYFVIQGTGLSTADGDTYLWWLNAKNNGGQVAPTVTASVQGVTTLVWDISADPTFASGFNAEGKSYLDGKGASTWGWTTTFGLTLADAATPAVITYIGYEKADSKIVEDAISATGISLKTVKVDDAVYSLSGKRVQKPVKGLYIIGGKKVIIM